MDDEDEPIVGCSRLPVELADSPSREPFFHPHPPNVQPARLTRIDINLPMEETAVPRIETHAGSGDDPSTARGSATVTVPRDVIGTGLGLIVFFGGVALLVETFNLAYRLFTVPPSSALGITQGKTLDLAKAGDSAASLVLKIVLLIVMAFVGSAIANRGIALYVGARRHQQP